MNGYPGFISPIIFNADFCGVFRETYPVRNMTTVEECSDAYERDVRDAAYCEQSIATVLALVQPSETDGYIAFVLGEKRKTLDV